MDNLSSIREALENTQSAIEKQIQHSADVGLPLGLIAVDLGRIDSLTARHGFEFRMELLAQFEARMKDGMRAVDQVIALPEGRFLIVIAGARHAAQTMFAANKVQRLCESSFIVQGQRIIVKPLLGIALFPEHAASAQELTQKAQLALESAVQNGGGAVRYEEGQHQRLVYPLELENELAEAIENGDFELAFQPKVDLRSGRPVSAEALIRWNRPSGQAPSPELFMQLADETGQIHALTKYVINAALRLAAEWPAPWDEVTVAVNLTPRVIQDAGLISMIGDARSIWNMPSQRLVLEVTESGLMESPSLILDRLHKLKAAGHHVSIDDFGTGYSSLSYFKSIPADELKIDKCFVMNMLKDAADAKIVETVITLGHNFGLKVVAEGVEDEATLSALAQLGCDYVQGYYISRPVAQDKFIDWLKAMQPEDFARPG